MRDPRVKPPFGAALDWGDPINQGLVGCWLCNEGQGARLNDISPYSNNGSISSPQWGAGLLSSCATIPYSASLELTTAGTVSVWCQSRRLWPSDGADYYFREIVSKTAGGGINQQAYYLDWYGTDSFRAFRALNNPIGTNRGFNITGFDMGLLPRHFVFAWDISTCQLYIDGKLYGTAWQGLPSQPLDAPLYVGGGFGTWDGVIHIVRIYNRCVTAGDAIRLLVEPNCGIADDSPGRYYSLPGLRPNRRIIDGAPFGGHYD